MNNRKKTIHTITRLLAVGLLSLNTVHTLGQNNTISDSLHPIELPSVGISWTKPNGEENFSVSNLNTNDIRKNEGNGSVNNLLDQIPSMVTTSDAGTGIGYTYMRIRGIDQTRINVTLNGIAINDAESQGSWLVNLPDLGGKTEHLEIQRGIGTSNNGATAFGATVNFTTLSPTEKPFFEISSSVGSFYTFKNTISASTGRIKDRFSAAIAYSNILSRGYVERANARLHSLFFTADYKMISKDKKRDHGTLKFNILYGNEKTGLAWNGVPADSLQTNRRYNSCGEYVDNQGFTRFYDNQTDNYQQTHIQLFYNGHNNPAAQNRLHYLIGAHLTRGLGYYEEYQDDKAFISYGFSPFIQGADTLCESDFITRKHLDNYSYGINFNIKQNIDKNKKQGDTLHLNQWNWSLGGDIKQYLGKHYGSILWAQYAGDIATNTHWYDGEGNKMAANLFGTLSYSNEHIFAYLDLQYRIINYLIDGNDEHLNNVTQKYLWNFFNPKAGISYSWKEKRNHHLFHSLYLSFALSHREPTRSDLTESAPARRPKEEKLYDIELGYRLKGNSFNFNINSYIMLYDNQLVLTGEINSVGAAVMTNVKNSYRMGVELIANYRPTRWFLWNFNSTLSRNKILGFTEFIDDWDNGGQIQQKSGTRTISFSPTLLISNDFSFTPIKNFDISFNTKFVGKQYLDNSQNEKNIIKPYCTSNLKLSYTINTQHITEIGIFFQINNIFNHQYESNGWLYKYRLNGEIQYDAGYFVQAGINFLGGIRLKF